MWIDGLDVEEVLVVFVLFEPSEGIAVDVLRLGRLAEANIVFEGIPTFFKSELLADVAIGHKSSSLKAFGLEVLTDHFDLCRQSRGIFFGLVGVGIGPR